MKLFFTLLLPLLVFAQSNRLVNNQPVRMSNGAPGLGYWQQQVDYKTEAELFPETKMLVGKETITYFNNSPDTLKFLVWHLYQNIFKKGFDSDGMEEIVGRVMTNTKGITIKKISIGNTILKTEIDRTIMETKLPNPLFPKTSIEIYVEWEYEIPNVASLRTGSSGNDFGICQWYPQIAVYDDQRGWDRDQYLGQGEFYLDYGNWDSKITVPANFVVCATGLLQNTNEVLTAEQVKRFNSITSQNVIQIIPPTETDSSRNNLKKEKRTWHFTAKDVRDFAWAASPRYVWDATLTNNNVRIYAFYYKGEDSVSAPYRWGKKVSNWDDGANMAKHAIEYFSKNYGNYIYPQATVVTGPVGGMEYPMFIFAGSGDPFTNGLYGVIAHELGHEWYPMMIGSHETNYAFMDEGFNTFITSNANYDRYGDRAWLHKDFDKDFGHNFREVNDRILNQRFYILKANTNTEATLMTHSNKTQSDQYGVMAYQKPGTVMFMLKDVLGDEVFSKALLEYYNRWLLKHPYPEDFYNTMEDVSGRDLDWFWNQWFYKTSKLDIAINSVQSKSKDKSDFSLVKFQNLGEAVMPFTLNVKLKNGKSVNYRVPETLSMFSDNFTFEIQHAKSDISEITIDPELNLADVDRTNNLWPYWSLNNYQVDFGFGIVNSIFMPLDKNVLNFAPSLSYNQIDGIEAGINLTVKYLSKFNFSETFRYDFKSKKTDVDMNFRNTLDIISPDLSSTVLVLNSDGRRGGGYILNYNTTNYSGMFGRTTTNTNFSTSIRSMELIDETYVDSKLWSKGILSYGTLTFYQIKNKSWGKSSVSLFAEFGIPKSQFYYSKTSIESKLRWNNLDLRLFGGMIRGGNIPNQTRFSLNTATQLEQTENNFFRSPAFSNKSQQKLEMAGGGNLFVKENVFGNNIIAANANYKYGMFSILANIGMVSDEEILIKKIESNLYSDIAVALATNFDINSPIGNLGFGFGVYFPIAEKVPGKDFTQIKAIGERIRFVIGTRF